MPEHESKDPETAIQKTIEQYEILRQTTHDPLLKQMYDDLVKTLLSQQKQIKSKKARALRIAESFEKESNSSLTSTKIHRRTLLKEIYDFYSHQRIMNSMQYTFEQINQEVSLLNLGKFSRIIYDLGLKIIGKGAITLVFNKFVETKRLMVFKEFVPAMEMIFVELRNEKAHRCEVEARRYRWEEKNMKSGKDASTFIAKLIELRKLGKHKKREAYILRKLTDPECIEIGYDEICVADYKKYRQKFINH